MRRIALIKPPIAHHNNRGVGVYTNHLYSALKHQKGMLVVLVDYGTPLNTYDIVHYPYFDPYFRTLPFMKKKKTVVTVHDLIPFRFPKYFNPGIRGKIKWEIQKMSLKTSRMILTDSESSKKDIIKYAGVREDRIKVIYLGVSTSFRVERTIEYLEKTQKKFNLPREYMLFVGDVNYNKNVPSLLTALYVLKNNKSEMKLVLVGQGFTTESVPLTHMLAFIKKLGLEDRVIRLGYVDSFDLICLYNLASVYVQPSFAEGFGLPVLEAMACGCPVVASNTTSLPEVVGDAGVLVDTSNPKNIVEAVTNVTTNVNLRSQLIQKGLEHVKRFTWEECANKVAEIYSQL